MKVPNKKIFLSLWLLSFVPNLMATDAVENLLSPFDLSNNIDEKLEATLQGLASEIKDPILEFYANRKEANLKDASLDSAKKFFEEDLLWYRAAVEAANDVVLSKLSMPKSKADFTACVDSSGYNDFVAADLEDLRSDYFKVHTKVFSLPNYTAISQAKLKKNFKSIDYDANKKFKLCCHKIKKPEDKSECIKAVVERPLDYPKVQKPAIHDPLKASGATPVQFAALVSKGFLLPEIEEIDSSKKTLEERLKAEKNVYRSFQTQCADASLAVKKARPAFSLTKSNWQTISQTLCEAGKIAISERGNEAVFGIGMGVLNSPITVKGVQVCDPSTAPLYANSRAFTDIDFVEKYNLQENNALVPLNDTAIPLQIPPDLYALRSLYSSQASPGDLGVNPLLPSAGGSNLTNGLAQSGLGQTAESISRLDELARKRNGGLSRQPASSTSSSSSLGIFSNRRYTPTSKRRTVSNVTASAKTKTVRRQVSNIARDRDPHRNIARLSSRVSEAGKISNGLNSAVASYGITGVKKLRSQSASKARSSLKGLTSSFGVTSGATQSFARSLSSSSRSYGTGSYTGSTSTVVSNRSSISAGSTSTASRSQSLEAIKKLREEQISGQVNQAIGNIQTVVSRYQKYAAEAAQLLKERITLRTVGIQRALGKNPNDQKDAALKILTEQTEIDKKLANFKVLKDAFTSVIKEQYYAVKAASFYLPPEQRAFVASTLPSAVGASLTPAEAFPEGFPQAQIPGETSGSYMTPQKTWLHKFMNLILKEAQAIGTEVLFSEELKSKDWIESLKTFSDDYQKYSTKGLKSYEKKYASAVKALYAERKKRLNRGYKEVIAHNTESLLALRDYVETAEVNLNDLVVNKNNGLNNSVLSKVSELKNESSQVKNDLESYALKSLKLIPANYTQNEEAMWSAVSSMLIE